MKEKNITFSGNFITKNDISLTKDEFVASLDSMEESKNLGDYIQSYSLSFQDDFLKIEFSDGSSYPRNPSVINTSTNESEPNPRQPTQIEPKEYFALIDFSKSFLWISNAKKRGMVTDFIRSKFKEAVINVKDIFNKDQFVESIKRIDDLRISVVPDILSDTNTLTQVFADEINRYDAVEATLHFKYHDTFVGNNIHDKIASIFTNREKFKSVMISGRDERNNGMLFNLNVFSKKIEFKAIVDENEMFDSENVFAKLIDKVKNEER